MSDPTHNRRRENLLRQLEKTKLNRSDFAKKAGVSRSYLTQLLTEDFRFGERAARALENNLGLPDKVLDMAEEPLVMTVEVWDKPSDLPDGVFAIVPRISVTLSAGAGAVTGVEMDLPPLAFREDWLRKKNVTSKTNLRTCEVTGDSMEPYLQDGDTVLIDLGQTELMDNEIYAIRYGDELRIKRLSKRFDGGIMVRSDNPAYPMETIGESDLEHVQVIGRMLWRGG
jgi:phage repressor protein C with HTH and peptisase S24 domain